MMERLLPPAASAHSSDVDSVIWLVHMLMLALAIGWGAYFVWVLIRFRRSNHPRADTKGASGRVALGVEVGVVAAEAALLIVIALPVWYARTSAMPRSANAVVVRVIAEQFAWNVHYPGADGEFGTARPALVTPENPVGLDRGSPHGRDDIVVINQLHLPVQRPVVVQLSSKDVIHSFGVPAMRVKQDAIPGVLAPIWFTPTREGTFDIACSQLCGLAHFRMRGIVTIESEDAFQRFLAEEAALAQ
jgi:cytochrome c oxidase subunit II